MTDSITSKRKLASGNSIPILGLGVWDSPSNLTTKTCLSALDAGYRHIDTAEVYNNETEVGLALSQSKLPRSEVFVTSKIYHPASSPSATREKLLAAIRKIDDRPDGYIDLMLIHNANIGADERLTLWLEMEKLHDEGRFKAIGVSNFGIKHLQHLQSHARIWPPAVNQLELHPWLQQRDVVAFCEKNEIAIEAYCPLVRNQKADDEVLRRIADAKQKTTAQVLIRYALDKGWIPLPKSDNPDRIRQNAGVFGWKLNEEELDQLDRRPQEEALVLAVDNEDE